MFKYPEWNFVCITMIIHMWKDVNNTKKIELTKGAILNFNLKFHKIVYNATRRYV